MESTKPSHKVVIVARLITTVVALAGAEGVLWFAGYPDWWRMDHAWGLASAEYQCDSDLGWRPREGTFDLVWDGLQTAPVRTTNWSDGRRATSSVQPGAGDTRPRVLFFGDSFVQGYGLSDPDTLPWKVQESHHELVVENFGSGDYGTYQAYLSMKKQVHGPASVYYMLNGYQEARNGADRSWLRTYRKSPPDCTFPYAVETEGKLEGHKSRGNLVWFLSRHVRTVALVEDYVELFEAYRRVRKERQTTEAILAAMKQTVASKGGTFTVILVDLLPVDRDHYREFLKAKSIPVVDVDLGDMHDKRYRLPDGHPNASMNQILAARIQPREILTARSTQ